MSDPLEARCPDCGRGPLECEVLLAVRAGLSGFDVHAQLGCSEATVSRLRARLSTAEKERDEADMRVKALLRVSPFDQDPPLGSHAADLKELRIVQAENDRLRVESAERVCSGSGWPSITTMAVSTGTGIWGICSRLVLVGPLNQCHTHRAVLSGGPATDAPKAPKASEVPADSSALEKALGALRAVLDTTCDDHADMCCVEWCGRCRDEAVARKAGYAILSGGAHVDALKAQKEEEK